MVCVIYAWAERLVVYSALYYTLYFYPLFLKSSHSLPIYCFS